MPGVAAAHGGEGAMFFAGEVLSLGLVALACLLVRTAVITRAIAFLAGVLATFGAGCPPCVVTVTVHSGTTSSFHGHSSGTNTITTAMTRTTVRLRRRRKF